MTIEVSDLKGSFYRFREIIFQTYRDLHEYSTVRFLRDFDDRCCQTLLPDTPSPHALSSKDLENIKKLITGEIITVVRSIRSFPKGFSDRRTVTLRMVKMDDKDAEEGSKIDFMLSYIQTKKEIHTMADSMTGITARKIVCFSSLLFSAL